MPPAPKHTDPTSLASGIREWLAANPGSHRPRDIAAGLGIPAGMEKQKWTMKVANETARLWRNGDLTKSQTRLPNWRVPLSTYSLAPPSNPEQ